MSGRSREAMSEGQGAERRSNAGHRVHFEALVAVGGLEGGAGFEAESVDVSAAGMRLRTAYLPTVGDKLVCRFDGLDGEMIVEGEVIWATEQQKGGEFAVRFVDIDDETREMLKQLCVLEDAEEASPKLEPESLAGTRVKLHIEGLGSPMKARVRSGDEREVAVGSSLEFLKLGRTVELEDVDRNKRRDGYVDAVKVEIDPATSVPQLVVSLRFDGVAPQVQKAASKAEMAVDPAPKTKPGIGPKSEAPKADVAANRVADDATKKSSSEALSASDEAPGTVRARVADPDAEIDEEIDFGKSKLRIAGDKAKQMTSAAMGKIGPALAGFGTGAKGVWSKVGEGLQKRREQRDADKKANAPRRVTAPPPSGALKAAGRKVVREDEQSDEPTSADIPKQSRKKAMLGAGLGLALVVGVFGVVKAQSGGSETAKKPVAALEARNEPATPAIPPIPNAAVTGEVPLFGPTPLSTTEQVPAPPPAASAAANKGGDASDGEGDAKEAAAPTQREWGTGDVANGKTLKIKMDGPIAGITGEETEGGFTVKVPGRKSVSSSSGLAHKDKRLAAVDVTNGDEASEIMIKFKGEVPGYLAKVKGDRLEITIGGESKKTASKSGKKKKGAPKSNKH